jgi:hypothetical protein
MGMILECRAVPALASAPHDPRAFGVLIGSASVNSSAVDNLLAPLIDAILNGVDLSAAGPAGVRFDMAALPGLAPKLRAAGVDADLYNTISDAADEALLTQSALWIGFA